MNGVLEVEATVVETGCKVSHLITRHARGLSEAQIQEAVAGMQSLKTHPRDEAVNRFLLRRAERVFQELPLLERRMLAEALDGFESALNFGEPAVIERHREALDQLLGRFERGFDENSFGGDGDERWK